MKLLIVDGTSQGATYPVVGPMRGLNRRNPSRHAQIDEARTACGLKITDGWKSDQKRATSAGNYVGITCKRCRAVIELLNADAIDGGASAYARLAERFWAKVERRGPDECWPWKGGTGNKGYGVVRVLRVAQPASRVAYQLHHRTRLAREILVCHTCDNPPCCNPAHLFQGTSLVNEQDKISKGRNRKAVGERAPTAKLTANQVREIRAEWEAGPASQSDLARRFGVGSAAISLVVRRLTWRHV